jgi:magnesium-transporting ATPase (P-type)
VAEQKKHPVLLFLKKFRGLSAWMLELSMVLSAVLKKYPDLVVVSSLLVVNALLSFIQERRAEIGTASALARDAAAPPPQSQTTSGKMDGMGDQSTRMRAMREKMMPDMKANDAKMEWCN